MCEDTKVDIQIVWLEKKSGCKGRNEDSIIVTSRLISLARKFFINTEQCNECRIDKSKLFQELRAMEAHEPGQADEPGQAIADTATVASGKKILKLPDQPPHLK
eukprot:g70875.t1